MMAAAASHDGPLARPSSLLPIGATLSVVAALLESPGNRSALGLAIVGAAIAFAGWFMYLRGGRDLSAQLGIRFFSLFAIALAISSLLLVSGGPWLGWLGVGGLWLAALGAGFEWTQGRTYGTGSLGWSAGEEG